MDLILYGTKQVVLAIFNMKFMFVCIQIKKYTHKLYIHLLLCTNQIWMLSVNLVNSYRIIKA